MDRLTRRQGQASHAGHPEVFQPSVTSLALAPVDCRLVPKAAVFGRFKFSVMREEDFGSSRRGRDAIVLSRPLLRVELSVPLETEFVNPAQCEQWTQLELHRLR